MCVCVCVCVCFTPILWLTNRSLCSLVLPGVSSKGWPKALLFYRLTETFNGLVDIRSKLHQSTLFQQKSFRLSPLCGGHGVDLCYNISAYNFHGTRSTFKASQHTTRGMVNIIIFKAILFCEKKEKKKRSQYFLVAKGGGLPNNIALSTADGHACMQTTKRKYSNRYSQTVRTKEVSLFKSGVISA